MVNLELVCLGVLYLCLLLAVLDGAEMSMQQWYHLPAQVRVLAVLGVLCILVSAVFHTRPEPAPHLEVKARRATMEDDLSVHSWVAQDFPNY